MNAFRVAGCMFLTLMDMTHSDISAALFYIYRKIQRLLHVAFGIPYTESVKNDVQNVLKPFFY